MSSDGSTAGGGMEREDWAPCEECDDPVRFDNARPYYKTADEKFWHDHCVDTGGGSR